MFTLSVIFLSVAKEEVRLLLNEVNGEIFLKMSRLRST